VAIVTGLALMAGAGALFWSHLPREGHTDPTLKAPALSWIVPLVVMALLALGSTLTLNALLRA
jgi:hypothetical protein